MLRFNISINDIGRDVIIKSTMKKYHFSDTDDKALSDIYGEIVEKCQPYAIYRINHRTTGIRYIDESQTAVCAITMGQAMDDILDGYKDEKMLDKAYMAECLASEMLLRMYDVFNQEYSKYHRRYVNRYIFIGDTIPLTNMQTILDDIYDNDDPENREIRANEYGVLIPSKSVVFYALLTDNPKQICAGICASCGRADCQQSDIKSTVTLNYGIQKILGNLKEVPNG
ncbi:MAG: hypothetical protein E7263_07345 [Lachnospiraceae bacterium]|nr:hypothetical protein [Lachnospiraceae bacterium]